MKLILWKEKNLIPREYGKFYLIFIVSVLMRFNTTLPSSKLSSAAYTAFINVDSKLTAKIKSKISKMHLNVEHNPPNLISEWYVMNVVVKNGESSLAKDCQMHVTVSALPPSLLGGNISFDLAATKSPGM